MHEHTQPQHAPVAGKVWLVGAGPGDAGLLTLQAARLLARAEVVVYDALVGAGVRAMIPPEAERVDVGKRAGHHPVPQAQIHEVLVERARAGKRVVRLKGGDPFLFGRGAEELEALWQAGVPAEVVPGVSSALAAPAYAGIPVTHRDHASALHIVTAHGQAGQDAAPDYGMLAGLDGTLVLMMGAARLDTLLEGLRKAGKDKDVPAALVSRGTTARQRCLRGTVGTLPEIARAQGVETPALLVVGSVAGRPDLDWHARRPLAGRRLVVTRPTERAGALADRLRDDGAEVVELPCIRTRMLPGPLQALGGYDWLVFTSPAGVTHFFGKLAEQERDIREIGAVRIAAVGPATAAALRERGLRVDHVPERFEVAAVGAGLSGRMLAVSAEEPVDMALDGGATLERLAVYETLAVPVPFEPEDVDLLAFASASAVRAFHAACPGVRALAACIGPTTAQAAREAGYPVVVAEAATIDSLVECIREAMTCR